MHMHIFLSGITLHRGIATDYEEQEWAVDCPPPRTTSRNALGASIFAARAPMQKQERERGEFLEKKGKNLSLLGPGPFVRMRVT